MLQERAQNKTNSHGMSSPLLFTMVAGAKPEAKETKRGRLLEPGQKPLQAFFPNLGSASESSSAQDDVVAGPSSSSSSTPAHNEEDPVARRQKLAAAALARIHQPPPVLDVPDSAGKQCYKQEDDYIIDLTD